MQITSFPEHIFWQYKPDADLPDMVVLESLLAYGDLDDLLKIHKHFDNQQIAAAARKMEDSGRWRKRVYFIRKEIQSAVIMTYITLQSISSHYMK